MKIKDREVMAVKAFQLYAGGAKAGEIAVILAKQGFINTAKGMPYTSSGVRHIIKRQKELSVPKQSRVAKSEPSIVSKPTISEPKVDEKLINLLSEIYDVIQFDIPSGHKISLIRILFETQT